MESPLCKTRVKICGITRVKDAALASSLGADVIGLVFSNRSPRKAEKGLIREVKALGIPVAGVYTSMEDVLKNGGDEDYVQLHFSHSASEVLRIKEEIGTGVISVIDSAAISVADTMISDYNEAGSDYVIIESRKGIEAELSNLRSLAASNSVGLSGKISRENIGSVLKLTPSLVDLSSSLELSPGIKDPEKMSAFFSEFRRSL